MSAKLVIKIVNKGTDHTNFETGVTKPSATGHMWWEIHESNDKITSYGFAPAPGYEGKPFAPGHKYDNDNTAYKFNESQGDYKREFDISDNQLETLKRFGDKPDLQEFGFDMEYDGIHNSCIDFTYKALDIIDFVPEGYNGDVWPTWNINNIRALPSYDLSDDQIFISKEGGLFILDNQNQMNVKLFGEASDITNNKANSLAIDSLKLGASKISIKDSTNQDIADFSVKQGDKTAVLNNSLLLKEEAKFFNKNGEEISQSDAIIKFEDTDLGELTLIRNDVSTTLSDGSSALVSSVFQTIDDSYQALSSFVAGDFSPVLDLIKDESVVTSWLTEAIQGLAYGKSPEEVAEAILIRTFINKFVDQSIVNYLTTQEKAELLSYSDLILDNNGSQLSEPVAQKLLELKNNIYYSVTISAIKSFVTSAIISRDEGWDSTEYLEAGTQSVAVAIAQKATEAAISSLFEQSANASSGSSSAGAGATAGTSAGIAMLSAGVATFVTHMVVASVKDLFADDHMNSHQWQSTTMTATALGAGAAVGVGAAILTGMAIGSAAGPVGMAIGAVIGVLAVSFGVLGGKKLGAGEYFDPYSYLKIEAKEDGTGNKIIGIEKEGVVAIAREYYHDDLYGNSGSDNLIGKAGTNTIYGYDGDDYIEGRGDIDLLVGGDGNDEIYAGNGDDQVYGGSGNDQLFGGNGNDQIVGGSGNDFILGGNGNDQIMGEEGDDQIIGGAGDDIILGGAGDDRIEGNEGDDSILGEEGNDIILGQAGSDVIDGGAGVDYIEGNDGNDNIRGGDGDDEILGGAGVDIIYGDAGNDIINSGDDNDLVFGGLGNDIIYGGAGENSLYGELGNDYVIGGDENDIIDGGDGDDVILGNGGDDSITTGLGNDTIVFKVGDGADIIDEINTISNFGIDEVGNDVIRLSDISSVVSSGDARLVLTKVDNDLVIELKDDAGNLTSDKITIKNQLSADFETTGAIVKSIEFADGYKINLSDILVSEDNSISYSLATYSNFDTTIQEELALGYSDQMQYLDEKENPDSTHNLTNYSTSGEQEQIDSEKYNEIQWRSYKKKRSAFGGHYTVWTKYYAKNLGGTNANDRIVGHWWNENIDGGNGDDQLQGGAGSDNLFGGEGNDILQGGTGNDNIYGQAGEDLIYGGEGSDNIDGGTDNDTIYGNAGNDTINGGLGDDYIEGNDGDDNITDNDGNNIIIAGIGSDTINTGAGNDKIEGNDDADIITSLGGNNLIYGNGGNDVISTGDGNDTIYGQEGFDLINAGAGDDYISGGAGNDVINGEDGNDTIYGDTGIDKISGGNGNDYIYGGSGADLINGDAGNDYIKAGGDDDFVEGGQGDDIIYGESGSDKIYGNEGDDIIYGGIGGDVIEGGDGNDKIFGGQGNDILVDGTGSDILDGGEGSDILILTKEIDENGDTATSTSIDIIKNFNKDEDKIILKVSYKTPNSFTDIQSNMVQNGSNVEINLDNGQKIIIENITTSDITSNNFQIGLSGGENNDILFGTEGNDIVFGEEGDDEIYGGDGNDELWGGKGSDELYGEGGDDILRYEADEKYGDDIFHRTESDETISYWGFYDRYNHAAHFFQNNFITTYNYSLSVGDKYISQNIDQSNDIFVKESLVTSKSFHSSYDAYLFHYTYWVKGSSKKVFIENARVEQISPTKSQNEVRPNSNIFGVKKIIKSDYLLTLQPEYHIKNFYNSELTNITGFNRTFDKFIGGDGLDTILMTEGNDVLSLDDPTSASGSDEAGVSTSARVQEISVIHAGAGDDVINFSTQKYNYGNIVIYGGEGDDKIWLNDGNDKVFGGEGNDEIYSGNGNDEIFGGLGDDIIYAGNDNDIIDGGSGVNELFGEEGDDIFIAGSGADKIDGGNGFDTVSYVNSNEAVNINLQNNEISGGDANNDNITNIENVIGSSFDDEIIGNSQENTLNGGNGNDVLQGGLGNDTYIYNSNSGTDIITEIGSDVDIIEFAPNILASDLKFIRNADNLEIQIGENEVNKLVLTNQYLDDGKIEILKVGVLNNETNLVEMKDFNISQDFYIANEDEELILENINQINQINEETGEEETRWPNISALYGMVIFNEETNEYKYLGDENFFGIDELTIENEFGEEKRTIFVNNVNDTPFGSIDNFEIKIENEFSINLSDYFGDVDGDKLTYQISLKGFNNLPDWINFNEETNILSGKSGRDGRLQFNIKATDRYGAFVEDGFKITITRDVLEDMVPIVEVFQIIGSEESDIIDSIENSADIIVAGSGDDVINFKADNLWQEYSNFIYNAWNVYSGDEISISGKVRSYDAFDGGEGYDILNLTSQNDVLFLDDSIVSNLGEIAKISGIEEINAGDGNDVIDLTSLTFTYDDIIINGGNGNDILWSSDGNDILSGEDGDDNLQSGLGDDILNGGNGDDILKAYDGDDIINGGSGADIMLGGDGNDQFIYKNITDSTIDSLDIILDFIQNEDIIKLETLGFDSINKLGEISSSDNNLQYYFDEEGNTIISDSNSNFSIKLTGEIELNNSDFVFWYRI